jgi:hypothetical protein
MGKESCETQTNHVSISPQEDRRGTAGALGKGKSAAEKGCLEESHTAPANFTFL